MLSLMSSSAFPIETFFQFVSGYQKSKKPKYKVAVKRLRNEIEISEDPWEEGDKKKNRDKILSF